MCVPLEELRTWLLIAHDLRMTDGEYEFIYVVAGVPSLTRFHAIAKTQFWLKNDGRDADARDAIQSVLLVCFPSLCIMYLFESRYIIYVFESLCIIYFFESLCVI